MVNNLFVLRTANSKINAINQSTTKAIEATPSATPVEESHIFAFAKPTSDLDIWHRRLVHLSYRNVIATSSNVKGMEKVKGPVPDKICEPCMKGRQQTEISRVPMSRPSVFLEKISVDIGGPLPTTARGNRIFILMKDYATGLMFWYSCKFKSEIFGTVTGFVTWIELQTGMKLKRITSGDELRSKLFDAWFKKTGVQWEPSAPYTYEQNAIIERAMYTVMAAVRSVMKDMKLPKGLWDLLGEAVVYTKNRTITTSTGHGQHITPFEGANKVVPNVSNLRALGCRAYTHIPKTTMRHKLDDRSWKGIFVGYGTNNQWRIYDPNTRKVHLTRDVRFDENYSYYDEDPDTPEDAEMSTFDSAIQDLWSPNDDADLDPNGRRSSRSEGDFIPLTPDSMSTTRPQTGGESSSNDEFEDAENDPDLSRDPVPSSVMPAPRQLEPPRVLPESSSSGEDTNGGESTPPTPAPAPSAPEPVRRRQPKPPPPPSERNTRTKAGTLDRTDYKKLNDKGLNNVYHAKQVPKSHIHMVRALHALQSGESYGLGRVSEPMSYKEAKASPYWSEWKKAMEDEIASHIKNGTWELVSRPKHRAVITGRWVFKVKYGVDGRILRFKARWVVHGYKQLHGIDYNETWAGVVRDSSFRTLFAISAERRLHIFQMDVVTAFLYGFVTEEIYVTQPEGFMEDPSLVCHLLKALYGLKQAPRVWYGVIREFLKSLGFKPTNSDASVFVSSDKKTYIAVYVDDLLAMGPNLDLLNNIKKKLAKRFNMTDLGPAQHYLGVEIIREGDSLLLRQTAYLTKVLERFGMQNCSVLNSPMEPGLDKILESTKEGQQADSETIYWYGSAIGCLMFASTRTRPDLSYALSLLSRFRNNPDSTHVAALQRVFRYVKGTLHFGLGYEPNQDYWHGYTDADWAGEVEQRHSVGGYVFYVAGGPVSWSSKRQDLVALSSCESEYIALCEAAKEAKWMRGLLIELGHIEPSPAMIWADNQGAMALSKNPEFHKRKKHIDARWHWVREAVEEAVVEVDYVSTGYMAADGFTKALGPKFHWNYLTLLRMAY